MIRFERVSRGSLRDVSLEIPGGRAAKIFLDSEADKEIFLDLLLGAPPEEGEVLLFGENPARLTDKRALELYRRIGFVWNGGGMISNLKVWENIVLPLWYHRKAEPSSREENVAGLLQDMGFGRDRLDGMLHSLPGNLTVLERRLCGFARAALMEADLMIYDAVLDGLDHWLRERVSRLVGRMHDGRPGRSSVYLGLDERSLEGLPAEAVFRQAERSAGA